MQRRQRCWRSCGSGCRRGRVGAWVLGGGLVRRQGDKLEHSVGKAPLRPAAPAALAPVAMQQPTNQLASDGLPELSSPLCGAPRPPRLPTLLQPWRRSACRRCRCRCWAR